MDMICFLNVRPEDHENFCIALDKLNVTDVVTEKCAMSNAEKQKAYRERKKAQQQGNETVTTDGNAVETKESTKENIYINNSPITENNSIEDLNNSKVDVNFQELDLTLIGELKEKEIKKEKEKRNGKSNASEHKKKYGQFRNVLLTDEELLNFQTKFPDTWKSKIEDMSIAIASKGYVYKSHYAALLNWARKSGDYTFESRKGERAFKEAQQQKLTPSQIGRMLDEMEQKKTEQVVDL